MSATILAALLVVMTGTQLSASRKDRKKLRLLLGALLGCEIVAFALLVCNSSFAESPPAWVVMTIFASINVGVAVAVLIPPPGPRT